MIIIGVTVFIMCVLLLQAKIIDMIGLILLLDKSYNWVFHIVNVLDYVFLEMISQYETNN